MAITPMMQKSSEPIKASLNDYLHAFEVSLYKLLEVNETSALHAPLRYSLEEGRRIRPRLSLIVADYYNLHSDSSYCLAAAIEMLHAFSLIQDDLPCMDNDGFRRGKAALHMKFDEHTALLTANSLFAKSFELLARTAQETPMALPSLVKLHSQVAGADGMSLGQWHDLSEPISDIDALIEMYRLKTGVLFGAALQMPSILAGATKKKQYLLRELGETLGVIYQIQDDLADYQKQTVFQKDKELNNIYYLGESVALDALRKQVSIAQMLMKNLGSLGQLIDKYELVSLSKLP